MYYDNKSSFYIKQYGSTALIAALSIVLILSGSVIFYFSTKTSDGNNIDVAETTDNVQNNNVEEETDALKEVPEVVKTAAYFDSLEKLTLSTTLKVTGIKNPTTITLENETSIIDVTLIGIDLTYVDANAFMERLKTDLLNKEVKIAFDNKKTIDNVNYAYLYVGDTLYNAQLLENGAATLKSERENTSLTNTLAQAQKTARTNSTGVWSK